MRRILDIRKAKVAVELTNRCNLRCGMCPMNKLGRPDADMPWWLVEKVAGEFARLGIRVNWLHEMGEPLLYPRLPEAIDLFPGCSVSTNAMLLDEDMGRRLLQTSLRRIRLCVDTVNPRVYPFIRRGGIFEEVVANIRTFLELSKGKEILVEIQRMITTQTAHESVRDFQEFFGLDRYPQACVIEKTCEPLDTSDETPLHESFYGCFQGYPFAWFIVLADGRVTHCCYDAHGQQCIGDLKTQTVEEILESAKLPAMMAAFKAKDWNTLPRCGECYKNAEAKPPFYDFLIASGRRLERSLPVVPLARRLINR
ncbi:MAG: radical SAM/SPASM domain-containing protein [Thermoanaerobaculum sp.]